MRLYVEKTLLIDLDGVLNQYKGNFDENIIPSPNEDTEKFLKNLSQNFDIMLFTTRNKLQACKWLIEYNLDKYFVDVTDIKKLSWLMIDDRCLKFEGNYSELIDKINGFKAWYK